MSPITATRPMKVVVQEVLSFDGIGYSPLITACLKVYAYKKDPVLRERTDIFSDCVPISLGAEEAVSRVLSRRPDLVMFPCYPWNTQDVLEVCRRLKRRELAVKIILGGREVAPQPVKILETVPEVDVIVSGEGEQTFAELLRHYLGIGKSLKDIKGISFREGAGVWRTEARPLLPPEELVSPYLSGLPEMEGPFGMVMLETSRGCPFDCKFCDWWTKQEVRWFPLERVQRELEYLAPRVGLISLADSDIFLNRERAKEVLKIFRTLARKHSFYLNTNTNPLFLDDECTRLLDSSQILVNNGVQSVRENVLKAVTRPFQFAKVDERMDRLNRLAPRALRRISLIYALPEESLEGYQESLEWTLSKHPYSMALSHMQVLTGSGVWKDPGKYGVEVDPLPPHGVLSTPLFPWPDLVEATRISAFLLGLEWDPRALDILYLLADGMKGKVERPYLSTFLGFFEFACERGVKSYRELRRAGTPEAPLPRETGRLWTMLSTALALSVWDEDPSNDLADALAAFVEKTIRTHGLEPLRPSLETPLRRLYGRNDLARRMGELRTLLRDEEMKRHPETFGPGNAVLVIGSGVVHLVDLLDQCGARSTKVDLEKCGLEELWQSQRQRPGLNIFWWEPEELLNAGWEAGSFDAIVVSPINREEAAVPAGELAEKLAAWAKPGGRIVVLESEGDEFPANRAIVREVERVLDEKAETTRGAGEETRGREKEESRKWRLRGWGGKRLPADRAGGGAQAVLA